MKRRIVMLTIAMVSVLGGCGSEKTAEAPAVVPEVTKTSTEVPVTQTEDSAPAEEPESETTEAVEETGQAESQTTEAAEETGEAESQTTEAAEVPEETEQETTANENLVDGMRPEFKEAMDSYEAFYVQYCEILKKYSENPTDLTILGDYTKFMKQSVEVSEKFEAWEEDEMNDAELKYYLEVNGRVTQMLLEVGAQ